MCDFAFQFQADLSSHYLEALDKVFEGTYKAKYPVVGYMDYLLDKYSDKFRVKEKKAEL